MMSAPPAMPAYRVSQPALLPMISMHITRLWLPAGGVDAVDHLGVDLHRGVETEGHIGAIDVVVNGLG